MKSSTILAELPSFAFNHTVNILATAKIFLKILWFLSLLADFKEKFSEKELKLIRIDMPL